MLSRAARVSRPQRLSFSWGVSNQLSLATTGISAGKPAFTDFTVVLIGGREVPELVLRTALGKHTPLAKFIVYENTDRGLVPRFELQFEDVVITGFQASGSTGDRIVHALSFGYARIKIRTYIEAPNGSVTYVERGWNLLESKKQ